MVARLAAHRLHGDAESYALEVDAVTELSQRGAVGSG
jgi:hypothetical protein